MASNIQQSFNQALYSIARARGFLKFSQYIDSTLEDRQIEQAEAEQEYRDQEAQKQGYKDASTQHEVQTAAQRAANDLQKKNPNFGFVTQTGKTGTAFGEPMPSERFVTGKLEEGNWESMSNNPNVSLVSYKQRAATKTDQKAALKEREDGLKNNTMEVDNNGNK